MRQVGVKTHTLEWAIHKQEDNQNCRCSPQGAMGLCSLGVLHQEDKPPERLALKARGTYFWRHRGLWETEKSHVLQDPR